MNWKQSLNDEVILFGAGGLGKLMYHALNSMGIKVDYFFDKNVNKQGGYYCSTKILTSEELSNIDKSKKIYITNNYFKDVVSYLDQLGFTNYESSVDILKDFDFTEIDLNLEDYDKKSIEREIEYNIIAYKKYINKSNNKLNLKCIDIVVTEKCSMKCTDCSNLMQYYEKPKNIGLGTLFKSIDKLVSCIDSIYEFRVIGGDPFMNKDVHKIINKLVKYDSVQYVAIYTNLTILPKDDNFECLKNSKVVLDITNYGANLSRNHDKAIIEFKKHGINYRSKPPGVWTDCGTLKFYDNSPDELVTKYNNCCMNDVTTLMDGILYRCPFSANASNLKAIKSPEHETIDLINSSDSNLVLKQKIKHFNNSEDPLLACNYCGGRDYSSEHVEPAVQIRKPLSYAKIGEY